jgi:shikimate dehydrogenase
MIFAPKAAVIGQPISHSLSPKIHNFLLQKHGIQGSYSAIEVPQNGLKNFVEFAISNNFAGFNVTIPHKEEIFKLCHFKSRSATLTGAVNTVFITPDKKLFGHNSDIEGFLKNLKYCQPNFQLANQNAFVIGAGGAARAVVFGLIKSAVKKIFITNRSAQKAEELIKDFTNFAAQKNCQIQFLPNETFLQNLNQANLLVNCTSLGMQSNLAASELKIDLTNANPQLVVCDIVYKPLITNLLKTAQSQQNPIVTGIGMLIFQALVGFEMWFGKKPEEKFVAQLFEEIGE